MDKPIDVEAGQNQPLWVLVHVPDDAKAGAVRSLFELGSDPRLNHRFEVTAGVLAEESIRRLQAFFARLRADK